MNASEIVSHLGGPAAAGRFFGVKPPSVMGWLDAAGIPEGRLIERAAELEQLFPSSFTRKDQWPDKWRRIWPELAAVEGQPAGAQPTPESVAAAGV